MINLFKVAQKREKEVQKTVQSQKNQNQSQKRRNNQNTKCNYYLAVMKKNFKTKMLNK